MSNKTKKSTTTKKYPPYYIMSFDGGGIRGYLSILILRKLLKENPDILDKIDLFAGTSTGGIIALGLAYGIDIDVILELYRYKGGEIFKDSVLDNLKDFGFLQGFDNTSCPPEGF